MTESEHHNPAFRGPAPGDWAKPYGARTNHVLAHEVDGRGGRPWLIGVAMCGASFRGRRLELMRDGSKPNCPKCQTYVNGLLEYELRALAPRMAAAIQQAVEWHRETGVAHTEVLDDVYDALRAIGAGSEVQR